MRAPQYRFPAISIEITLINSFEADCVHLNDCLGDWIQPISMRNIFTDGL